jgi:hypothetical protein
MAKNRKNLILFEIPMTYRYSCMKKVSLFFPSLICRIRDKRRSDPDPGYRKMVGSRIRDKHPGSATLVPRNSDASSLAVMTEAFS